MERFWILTGIRSDVFAGLRSVAALGLAARLLRVHPWLAWVAVLFAGSGFATDLVGALIPGLW